MKKLLLLTTFIACGIMASGQTTVVFSDDFESGVTNWVLNTNWGLSTAQAYSPTKSLSESPTGNYLDNEISSAKMANGVNLTTYPSAQLKFYARYQIEAGFDYMYVDVSNNDFTNFNTLAVFDGNSTTWTQYTLDLGGYCGAGNTNVKVRFRFESDGGLNMDGMYIDNFQIIGSNVDNSPPLIVHTPPVHYQGSIYDHIVLAELIDFSGIAAASVNYKADGVSQTPVSGVKTPGTNLWSFTIPAKPAGTWISYVISATDSATTPNTAVSDSGKYIAGNYIGYDNAFVDFYRPVGPAEATRGVAVRVTLGNTDLKTVLIRNYTDQNNPNSPMTVHIWSNNNGLPGTNLITPILVTPEATLTNTRPMTRVDLRAYASQLSNLSGDIFIGYDVPTGICNTVETSPGFAGRSYTFNGTTWSLGTIDFHFRAITTADVDVVGPLIVNNTIPVHYQGQAGVNTVMTTITDASGVNVSNTKLHYKVDGVAQTPLNANIQGNNQYSFDIPTQAAGSMVNYWISSADQVSPTPNVSVTDTFRYIAGNYIAYDNGLIQYYGTVGPAATGGVLAAAVKVTLSGTADLKTILIRNYDGTGNSTPTPPNAPMLVHVWNAAGGLPTTDKITPVQAIPEATVANNSIFTRVDMRPYAAQLSGLSGDFFIGFSVPTGVTNLLMTQPGTFNRSYNYNGTAWSPAVGTNGNSDYHFRCITTAISTGTNENATASRMYIFPNPVETQAMLVLEGWKQGNYTVQLHDLTGRLISSNIINVNGDAETALIPMEHLGKGIYLMTVSDHTTKKVQKVIKQ